MRANEGPGLVTIAHFDKEKGLEPSRPSDSRVPMQESPVGSVLGDRASRSYVMPALELTGYLLLLNQFDRHFVDPNDIYRTALMHSDIT